MSSLTSHPNFGALNHFASSESISVASFHRPFKSVHDPLKGCMASTAGSTRALRTKSIFILPTIALGSLYVDPDVSAITPHLSSSAPASPTRISKSEPKGTGYLKKVARIDTCRGQESVRTMSNQPVPEVRLMSPSTASSPATMARTSVSGGLRLFLSNASLTKSSAEDNEYESEEEEEQVIESSKRRRRRHLLPSSFLNLLPPGTPRSGRSSSSSGFKSSQSRPASVSDDYSNNIAAANVNRHNGERATKNSHLNDQVGHRSSSERSRRKSPSQSPRATTPTTFCPTIASALWRPLWPPGWHPRSSSSTTSAGPAQHPGFGVLTPNSRANTVPESSPSCGLDNSNHMFHTSGPAKSVSSNITGTTNSPKGSTGEGKMSEPSPAMKGAQLRTQTSTKNSFGHKGQVTSNGESLICYDPKGKLDIFNNEDYEKVEDWLDEHPVFVHQYFVRKASRSLIDSWLLAHSSSMATLATLSANQTLTSNENSGANTPVRKISAHEFEASGGGFLRPMVSTTCDGTPTFLPIQDSDSKCRQNGTENESTGLGQPIGGGTSSAPLSTTYPPHSATLSHSHSACTILNLSSADHSTSPTILQSSPLQSGTFRFRPMPISSMKSREELEAINDEKELIFELVKDICNDLEVRSLCHKILKNVSILTNADRCSLFLVRGEKNDPNSRYLASQLFDVSGQSTIEQMAQKEEITIPWGTGIVGHVADKGVSVNIPDCYKDFRFTNSIDQKTGYTTRNMLCNPIYDFNGQVMGVAQVINKNGAPHFTSNDEAVFAKYLQFCGIGIRNAQIYERSQLENKRNQVLLDLARMVFEKQSNIENIIFRILVHILSLLQCERGQILLLTEEMRDADFYYYGRTYQDPYAYFNMTPSQAQIANEAGLHSESVSSNASTTSESSPIPPFTPFTSNNSGVRSFSRVFDLDTTDLQKEDFEKTRQTPFEGRFPINIGVTGYVATTGETLNIPDAYSDTRFDPEVDKNSTNGFRHKTILCMPIRNATRKIIGVAQLVNKLNGRPFNKNDENLFEAFAIFSGMGIENTQMFEKAVKAMAKQKVTLELLSYHASATDNEASKFARMLIPSTTSLALTSLSFDDFSLNEDQMIKACIRMFIDLDLIERFHIDYKVLCKWILSVRKNYRPVVYHNWRHAFNVAQMMFAIIVNTNLCLTLGELETLALIVACLCHDLDHRGTNNSFQIKTSSPLAQLYSTSTLEHHHFDQSLMILNSQGNQILSNLSPEEYRRVVSVLEEAILATDLAVYFRKREDFFDLINNKTYDWRIEEHRSLLRSMLMTCCDIAAITKPWEIQKVVAELVASEFFHQGDIEKAQLNIEPIDMMNREKKDELPKMQMSFIDTICLPVYEAFAKLCPMEMKNLLKGVFQNRDAWTLLSTEPYQLQIRSPITTPATLNFCGGPMDDEYNECE